MSCTQKGLGAQRESLNLSFGQMEKNGEGAIATLLVASMRRGVFGP